PTGQDSPWQDILEPGRETVAEPTVVAHRAYHLAHHIERGEVGNEQHGEPPYRAHHMILQIRSGPLLQAEADPDRCRELDGRSELDRTVRWVEMQVRRRRGRSGRG